MNDSGMMITRGPEPCGNCDSYAALHSANGLCDGCARCVTCGKVVAAGGCDQCTECGDHALMRSRAKLALATGDLFRTMSGNILRHNEGKVALEPGTCNGCDSPAYLINLDQYGQGRCCADSQSLFA